MLYLKKKNLHSYLVKSLFKSISICSGILVHFPKLKGPHATLDSFGKSLTYIAQIFTLLPCGVALFSLLYKYAQQQGIWRAPQVTEVF